MGEQGEQREIRTAKEAADDELVLAFGRLQGAANRLEYILGRAGEPGLSMRAISREQVLTTGGVTRLVDRMEAAGLVRRVTDPDDRRGRLVRLTPQGEETAVRASRLHVENIRRYLLDPLPAAERERVAENLRVISHAARDVLPQLP